MQSCLQTYAKRRNIGIFNNYIIKKYPGFVIPVDPRFLDPQYSQTSRKLRPNVILLGFASVPPISQTPDSRIFVSFGGSRDRESSEKFRKEQVGLDWERIEINFQASLYFYPQKSLFLPVNRCLR